MLARMAPPTAPDQALEIAPDLQKLIAKLNPLATLSLLAAMMMDASLHPHGVRLDWAARLVLSHASGNLTPRHKNLDALLNERLVEARVSRLEDPAEDVFVDAILTPRGDYLIFTGLWEKAGLHTEWLLRAFLGLPDGEPKSETEECVYALLRLSDALVRRSGLCRGEVGGKIPARRIAVLFDNRLKELRSHAFFTWAELDDIGVTEPLIAPFVLDMKRARSISRCVPGDSAAEFTPLITTKEGVLVAFPANISTAIRALLVGIAVSGGMRNALCGRLMAVHDEVLEESDFIKVRGFTKPIGDACLIREAVFEESAGRYVHVLQLTDGFQGWPNIAFGATSMHPGIVNDAVVESILGSKKFIESRPDYIDGVTVLVLGGWGSPRGLQFDRRGGLEDWLVISLEPADALVLGACDDGSLADIWRMYKELNRVRGQGFNIRNTNGILNLFQWWRTTDHALVPPHLIEVKPPTHIAYDTNLLLDARLEAVRNIDRRSILHPSGTYHRVGRFSHKASHDNHIPIYASLDSVGEGKLLGAVIAADTIWWLELTNPPRTEDSATAFETWKAATQWLARVMPLYIERTPTTAGSCILVRMHVEPSSGPEERTLDDDEIERTVSVEANGDDAFATIVIKPEWHWALHRPDNQAEIVLAARLLTAVGTYYDSPYTSLEVERLIRDAVPGDDIRWRHSFQAGGALDRLISLGWVGEFAEISDSAAALQKCGTGWARRPRDLDGRIVGKAECVTFLLEYADELIARLRSQIAQFDRTALIVAAFRAFQAAQAEHRRWDMTARAMRAILGVERDQEISLRQATLANGVIRGTSILIEIAAADSDTEGTRAVGAMDLDELQALATLYFHTVDMLAAVYGDRIEAKINISPTGDVLHSQEFERLTLRTATEKRHKRERASASEQYLSRFENVEHDPGPYAALRSAIAAEYGADADTVFDLAIASVSVLQQHGCADGVLVIRRSEFVAALETLEPMRGKQLSSLVDRMTLPWRPSWNALPAGAMARDFDLGKFDRRYSLVGRPVVSLGSENDPMLVVAPGVIERALKHNITGAHGGSLQNDFWVSNEMRRYSSDRGRIEGLEFNDLVAEKVRAIGLKAWPSAKPSWCLNMKATPELKKLGDIDVLAVSPDGRIVWVIEAKDLKLCRTLGEAASRLSDYRGKLTAKGEPDKLLRHLTRVAYIRENKTLLVERLGLLAIPETVCGLVVVHAPQPMEEFPGEVPTDGRITMLAEIESVPWGAGWSAVVGTSRA